MRAIPMGPKTPPIKILGLMSREDIEKRADETMKRLLDEGIVVPIEGTALFCDASNPLDDIFIPKGGPRDAGN